ncbi:hypothetical protein LCGC14_1406230 [marine sediment metagenome]|uniref:Uncharacterized protein n=1 Tax=marine sediment metagenome TaxID=412755 RepID=A0A0F9MB25_9ZZZZ
MDIIVKIFKHLCLCELRKNLGIYSQNQEGLQDGYIMCLTDLFGAVDDEISESMFQREKTYIHVTDHIINEVYEIEEFKDELEAELKKERRSLGAVKDLDRLEQISKSAVKSYFLQNKQEMLEAIKFL